MSNIRIRTTPGGSDKFLNVKLDQKFDFIEILSLKLSQEEVYQKYCSDYGAVVGRVIVNNGLGVPNAKVSIFIPIDDIDKEDSEIFGLYPYEEVSDINSDGLRYNLLPKNNETNNNCFTPIGSFPTKREVQDNDEFLYIYCKYYKFTTTTNISGDYMFFGVPIGTYQLHVDADMSDIGLLSQYPYDLIREGYNEKLFENGTKFKSNSNLNTLAQLKTFTPISIDVQPFWGDIDNCQVGISRLDVDLSINIKSNAIFIGSVITDTDKNSINFSCRPRVKVGLLKEMITGPGRIEMIRKNEFGETERYDVEGGELIDDNGTWAYQVPMNLDYIITDEFGNLQVTDDKSRGLPTRARVRFRIKMNQNGGEGRLRSRASYLVPNNPKPGFSGDYTFDERTRDDSFIDLYWNKIYTVSNYISRVQKNNNAGNRNFIGIKNTDDSGSNLNFPFNRFDVGEFGGIDFDFYNDWVNGSLYFFMFKYKERNLLSNNFCKSSFLYSIKTVDTCTNCKPQNHKTNTQAFPNKYIDNSVIDIDTNGLIIQDESGDNELYYTSVNFKNIKLYSTDIVNLGSILDCDWQGKPIFYKYLPDTTFNIQPEDPENHEGGQYDGEVEVSGYKKVFIDNGTFSYVKGYNCNNVKRICELGVGLDEDRRDIGGIGVDNEIVNNDVESPTIRGLFAYLNDENINQIRPIVFDLNSRYDYSYPEYKIFRGYNTFTTNTTIWQFKKSLYFYFGLIPGKSALNKMYVKYLSECNETISSDLKVIIDNIINDGITGFGTGEITFHIEGGVGPYTFQWLGPTYNGIQYQCPDQNNSLPQTSCGNEDGSSFTLENLLGGQYTVIVNDSSGQQTTTTVNLSGINSVQCQITPTPVNNSGNGKININITGGAGPYTVTINGITDPLFTDSFITNSQVTCYGDCLNNINNLPVGDYVVTVVDSGIQVTINGQQTTINTQCSSSFIISEPSSITLNITQVNPPCYGELGSGYLTVNGGVPPFNISWLLTSTNNINNQQLVGTVISTSIQPSNLVSGTYMINVTDLAGNFETTSIVISEPTAIQINQISTNAPGYALSASGSVNFTLSDNQPPYTISVENNNSGQSSLIVSQTNSIIINDLLPEQYNITINNVNGCETTFSPTIPLPQYGLLYVRAFIRNWVIDGVNKTRVIVRFRGGHGNAYHFRLPNGNWVNLSDPYPHIQYLSPLPQHDDNTLSNDYVVYQSTTLIDNQPSFEFQFWLSDSPSGSEFQPFDFDYYLTDNNQEGNYAMFMGRLSINQNGFNNGTQDSHYGTLSPYGFYSYRNNNNTPVFGNTPQGVLITQP
jgi:hypothetical protein